MPSAVITTGSTLPELAPGLRDHFAGVEVIKVLGNPSGIVVATDFGQDARGVSGAMIAYDPTNDKYYRHVSGANFNVWNELGSTAFS